MKPREILNQFALVPTTKWWLKQIVAQAAMDPYFGDQTSPYGDGWSLNGSSVPNFINNFVAFFPADPSLGISRTGTHVPGQLIRESDLNYLRLLDLASRLKQGNLAVDYLINLCIYICDSLLNSTWSSTDESVDSFSPNHTRHSGLSSRGQEHHMVLEDLGLCPNLISKIAASLSVNYQNIADRLCDLFIIFSKHIWTSLYVRSPTVGFYLLLYGKLPTFGLVQY